MRTHSGDSGFVTESDGSHDNIDAAISAIAEEDETNSDQEGSNPRPGAASEMQSKTGSSNSNVTSSKPGSGNSSPVSRSGLDMEHSNRDSSPPVDKSSTANVNSDSSPVLVETSPAVSRSSSLKKTRKGSIKKTTDNNSSQGPPPYTSRSVSFSNIETEHHYDNRLSDTDNEAKDASGYHGSDGVEIVSHGNEPQQPSPHDNAMLTCDTCHKQNDETVTSQLSSNSNHVTHSVNQLNHQAGATNVTLESNSENRLSNESNVTSYLNGSETIRNTAVIVNPPKSSHSLNGNHHLDSFPGSPYANDSSHASTNSVLGYTHKQNLSHHSIPEEPVALETVVDGALDTKSDSTQLSVKELPSNDSTALATGGDVGETGLVKKSSWLLRLFESKLFDMSMAIAYLFNSKEHGVQAYIGGL